jgi:uncharacterized protein
MMENSLERLRNQFVGFLKSESLFGERYSNEILSYQLEEDPEMENEAVKNIQSLSIKQNTLLGKRVESFFDYYLYFSNRYNVIAKNIQIINNKVTEGELDFIIEDQWFEELIHVELVFKYYLYKPDEGYQELERWVGPNRNDSLVDKMEKLKIHQLPILHKKETAMLIEALVKNRVRIIQKVCFKACLFVPKSLQDEQFARINQKCIQGVWIRHVDFTIEAYGHLRFFIPEKQDWLIEPHNCKIWLSFKEVKIKLDDQIEKKNSPLLWVKTTDSTYTKMFVVWW